MLHPIMPHLTEELYSRLPGSEGLLMGQSWPELPASFDRPETEASVERAFEATRALRSLRAGLDLAAMKPVPIAYYEGDLLGGEEIVRTQAWVTELRKGKPEEKAVAATVEGIDLYLPITGNVDVEKLLPALERDIAKAEAEIAKGQAQLSNPNFVQKVPPQVLAEHQQRDVDLKAKLEHVLEALKALEG